MRSVLTFIATWIILGLITAWFSHSESITGKRDDQ